MSKDEKKLDAKGSSRRKFLKSSGMAVGGIAVGGAIGGLLSMNDKGEQPTPDTATEDTQPAQQHDQALEYFTNGADFDLLGHATERIFPEDENGPGAIGLGVPYYIDHQLAGKWGINAKDYRQGPFFDGKTDLGGEVRLGREQEQPNLGYQSQLKYHQIYDLGIEAIENHSQATFNEGFTALDGEQQDEVLVALENDEVDIPGIKSSFFFNILRQSTLEGAYADPLYGGNKDMQGWKMKEYPGVQLSYTPEQVESKEFIEINPSSLHTTFNT
ncbi:gluconate 2-dehydrogenase subunit 3 family protein [Oceanobacillus sp. CF4.6]|uniref:gluconate 2-dehydrogenase subunit 3 family protein n=1 Tax=Oceanobacillus sp. CF4.6 TaxID=3373080 RepID=UPI003EE7C075